MLVGHRELSYCGALCPCSSPSATARIWARTAEPAWHRRARRRRTAARHLLRNFVLREGEDAAAVRKAAQLLEAHHSASRLPQAAFRLLSAPTATTMHRGSWKCGKCKQMCGANAVFCQLCGGHWETVTLPRKPKQAHGRPGKTVAGDLLPGHPHSGRDPEDASATRTRAKEATRVGANLPARRRQMPLPSRPDTPCLPGRSRQFHGLRNRCGPCNRPCLPPHRPPQRTRGSRKF